MFGRVLSLLFLSLLCLSCERKEGGVPQYSVTGLWRWRSGIDDVTIGISRRNSLPDTASWLAKRRHVLMFDDDQSFKWLAQTEDTCYLEAYGTFRVNGDTLRMMTVGGNVIVAKIEPSPTEGYMYLSFDAEDGPAFTRIRYFLGLREIRYARRFYLYEPGDLWSHFGLSIPKSRRLFRPNELKPGFEVGTFRNDTSFAARYDCLWDIRADSTIVEYVACSERRVRRMRQFHIEWDSQDVSDTIIFVEPDGTLRKYELTIGDRGGLTAIRRVPYERYDLYDVQSSEADARAVRRLQAYVDYVDE